MPKRRKTKKMNPRARAAETFSSYLKSLLKIVAASFLALGLVVAIVILAIGTASIDLEIGIEIERIDALWLLVGLPVTAILICTVLSPISYFVYKLFLFPAVGKSTGC